MAGTSQENRTIRPRGAGCGRLSIPPAFRKLTRWIGIGFDRSGLRSRSGSVSSLCTLLIVIQATLQPVLAERLDVGRKIVVRAGSVIDGDSIMVKKDNQDIEVRLFGIDAPEFDQPGSKASRRHLAALVKDRSLLLAVMDHDMYGRTVALLSDGAVSVNEEQVRTGQAWVHPRYCRIDICERWRDLQQRARYQKVGLWHYRRPIPPWRWKARKAARR